LATSCTLVSEPHAAFEQNGADVKARASFAARCQVARRLIERGVRVVERFDVGSNTNWDSHTNIDDHRALSRNIDRPIASLVTDLRQRGLLDETLILGCSEFGRTPWQAPTPRCQGQHSRCFTCFLGGGGVMPGLSHGVSDEYGNSPPESPVHVHDLHATVLRLMGLDHTRLTYCYSGPDFRLTDIHGKVVQEVIG
jgi:uncharacterized protein (DUF1501 family)